MCFVANNYYDEVKENEMVVTCSVHWRYKKWMQNFCWGKNIKTEVWIEVNMKIDIREIECNGLDWVHFTQDRLL